MPLLHFFAWEPCPRSFCAHLPFLLFIQDGWLVDIFFMQVREGVLKVKSWKSHVSPILHSPTYFPFNFCNLLHFDLPNCIIQLQFSDLITRSTGSLIPHSQTNFCYIHDFSTFLLHIAHFCWNMSHDLHQAPFSSLLLSFITIHRRSLLVFSRTFGAVSFTYITLLCHFVPQWKPGIGKHAGKHWLTWKNITRVYSWWDVTRE